MFGTAEVGTWVPRSRTGAAVLRTGAAIFEPLATDPMKTHFRSFFRNFFKKWVFLLKNDGFLGSSKKCGFFQKKSIFLLKKVTFFLLFFFKKIWNFFQKKRYFWEGSKCRKYLGKAILLHNWKNDLFFVKKITIFFLKKIQIFFEKNCNFFGKKWDFSGSQKYLIFWWKMIIFCQKMRFFEDFCLKPKMIHFWEKNRIFHGKSMVFVW